MNFSQLVYPNLNQKTDAGWCLKFTQDAFGAPVMYASATDAANATRLRQSNRSMPRVAVPVWFDHWGTYQGRYANWGHVVVWVPGRGFLSSPASGFGQLWLSSLEAVERTFNAKYRFWSLDINTLQVAKLVEETTPESGQEEDEDMGYVAISGKAGARRGGVYAVVGGRAVFLPGSKAEQFGIPVISDEAAIAGLQSLISGLK